MLPTSQSALSAILRYGGIDREVAVHRSTRDPPCCSPMIGCQKIGYHTICNICVLCRKTTSWRTALDKAHEGMPHGCCDVKANVLCLLCTFV